MESNKAQQARFGRQSSLAPPERRENSRGFDDEVEVLPEGIDPRVRLMYLANEGDSEGIRELLDSGTDVNFKDVDGRTALHVAACQGRTDVVQLLLRRGADVNLEDRWGSTYPCRHDMTLVRVRVLVPDSWEIIGHVAEQTWFTDDEEEEEDDDEGGEDEVSSILKCMPVDDCQRVLLVLYLLFEKICVLLADSSAKLANGRALLANCVFTQPFADAIFYKNHEVIKLLEEHGAKPPVAPMHVQNAREVPEYEIHPSELDFTKSVNITKGTFCSASWRGIQVAVKLLGKELFTDEDKIKAFTDELALLQKLRHPNVVQFLGAVTQSNPMMIVTEYLPKGDLRAFLKRKGSLKPIVAVKFALDIARGMNYLHEHKPEAIIHRDLEPSNILRDDSGHLKVADFGVSKLLKVAKTVKEDKPVTCQDTSWRYVAPEVFKNEEYDTKVDVFSFALILQEMLAWLIEECWRQKPFMRPTFAQIIVKLEDIGNQLVHKRQWKLRALQCLNLESMLKLDRSNPSSHSSSSSIR
ncbi:hypothetical protein RHMOL_Rhmol06G0167600 [Rhododendron molle]|uniref:Uncharacterized protein n=1 Tax=Rhododendron molle TaxID=49168 RepID=A0ACC0ND79_RHOML|nr:hypothetical protein RHMOL_Rhmol06G0167600 [Rhododendron molle]